MVLFGGQIRSSNGFSLTLPPQNVSHSELI
jgi:hypothetical protein